MGENINLEWERDPYPDLVWDALQLIKVDAQGGMSALLNLGAEGSSLALMYAGHRYARGIDNVPKNEEAAIRLLQQSLDLGSLEGGYLLGFMHMAKGRLEDGLDTYNRLSDLGYAPAMYVLGYHYVFGDPSLRNTDKGEEFFKRAARRGHFWARRKLANLMIRRKTIHGFLSGWIMKFAMVIPFVYYRLTYPNSDRLRT
jgi:TPR repeat protein